MNLVATHDRCDIPYTYSWKKEHNLPGHYGPYAKDLEELFQRASEIDNIVLDVYKRQTENRVWKGQISRICVPLFLNYGRKSHGYGKTSTF